MTKALVVGAITGIAVLRMILLVVTVAVMFVLLFLIEMMQLDFCGRLVNHCMDLCLGCMNSAAATANNAPDDTSYGYECDKSNDCTNDCLHLLKGIDSEVKSRTDKISCLVYRRANVI